MLVNNWNKFVGVAVTAITNNNDRILEVYCPDMLPTKLGKMSLKDANFKKKTVSLKTPDGKNISTSVEMADTIECEYIGRGTNRDVPDIHVGEQLVIHNYTGMEKFYWSPLGKDDNIRRVEHYKISIADERITNKELTDDNTYHFEMDTRNAKKIRFKTSRSDGEEYVYQFVVDAEANTVTLWDENIAGEQNHIFLDSNIPMIQMTNRELTNVELRSKDINMYAPNDMNIVVDNNYNLLVGNNKTTTVLNHRTDTVTGNDTTSIKGNFTHTILGMHTLTIVKNYTITVTKDIIQTCIKWTTSGKDWVAQFKNITISAKKAAITDEDGKALHVP